MEAYSSIRFLTILALLGGAVYLSSLFTHHEENLRVFFSDALRSARIEEDVLIGETRYHVQAGNTYKNGQPVPDYEALSALRLAYEKTIARRTPLMAIAGTDPDDLEDAIRALEETRSHLAELQETPHETFLVQSALYPIAFLRSLAELERARLAFIESGSQFDAWKYRIAMRDIFSIYRHDLYVFRRAFLRGVPENVRGYATPRKIITRHGILRALDDLTRGINKTESRFRRRLDCTHGRQDLCAHEDLLLPKLIEPPEQSVSPQASSLVRKVTSLLVSAGIPLDTTDSSTVLLSKSLCTEPDRAGPFYSIYPDETGKYRGQRILFTGDLRFVRSEEHRRVPFFDYLKERRVAYVLVPLGHYTCLEIGHDWGRLFSTLAVRDVAVHSPLSAIAPWEMLGKLKKLEASLTSSIVKERDAVEYVATAQRLTVETEIPQDILKKIEPLLLQIHNKSTNLDQMVLDVARTEGEAAHLNKKGIAIDISVPYLFFVRSGFPLLFLSTNPSAVGTLEDLFEVKTTPADSEPYLYYSSMRLDSRIREVLVHDVTLRREILESLSEGF